MSGQSSKCIQMIFKCIEFKKKMFITKEIYKNFLVLVKNLNGVYSIINLITHFQELQNTKNEKKDELNINNEIVIQAEYVLDMFHKKTLKNIYEISSDRYGCCFIQKYMDTVMPLKEEKILELIKRIKPYFEEFLTEKFANYILQSIISYNYFSINKKIIRIILKKIDFYCNSNVTSNIVEIFLENNQYCDELIQEVINDKPLLRKILFNPYGNYGKKFILIFKFFFSKSLLK